MTTHPTDSRDRLDRSSSPRRLDRPDRPDRPDRLDRDPANHPSEQTPFGHDHIARRAVAATGLAAIALVHVLDLPGKISETPYLGVMYIGLAVAALVLAELLLVRDDKRVWAATGALAIAVIVGYVINRTVGMPGATGDIGNWLEPLGLASLVVESFVVLLAAGRLARH